MTAPCPRRGQAVGLVLHALERGEEADLRQHLPGCAQCRAAVDEAEAVLSRLGAAVEQVDPPARLRSGLLDAARRNPPTQLAAHGSAAAAPGVDAATVPPGVDDAAPTLGSASGGQSAPAARQLRDARPARSRGARPDGVGPPSRPDGVGPPSRPDGSAGRSPGATPGRRRRYVAAALALVAVLGLGGLTARTLQLQAERDAQAAQMQTVLEMVARFDAPGARHAWLASAPGAPPVAAVMQHDTTVQFLTVGLPENAAGRDTYVLWGTGAGAPRAIDTFDVSSGQSAPHAVDSAAGAGDFAGYAISLEPGRSAPASPSTVVASGQVEL